MCLGGGSKAPPKPEPVPPAPPPVQGTQQVAPTSAGSSTNEGTDYGEMDKKKKGKSALTIPLVSNTGTGLQIGG